MARSALPVLELDDPLRQRPAAAQSEPPEPRAAKSGDGVAPADEAQRAGGESASSSTVAQLIDTADAADPAGTGAESEDHAGQAKATGVDESRRPGRRDASQDGGALAVRAESRRPWRAWGRATRTATYRLPEDLVAELDARARALGLPLGVTVAAGVLALLDEDDDTIVAAVERVEDARLQAARSARRCTLASGEATSTGEG